MKILILLTLLSLSAHASDEKQFPNPGQVYIPGKDAGFNQYLTRSLKGTKKIALTFDDGPDVNLTPKLLDTLKKFGVHATFFVLTERFNDQTLPIVKRMLAEGHNLGSHHLNHISNDTKTEVVYRSELKQSIISTAGLMESENAREREIYYRFPYGAYGSAKLGYHHMNVMKEVSQQLFGDNCINFVFWDVDTVDWLEAMTPDDITQNVMANIFGGTGYDFKKNSNGTYSKITLQINHPIGGGVVLMHDVHARSVDAVPKILQKFKDQGVEVVSLQDIEEYAYKGKECRLINGPGVFGI
ncbi:MAG: polysaccharide deacetylase family protein [Bacteriovorax sp.]|nr:polysaccharide deacetylase family protein [Bacteriovorax sp.]